MTNKQMKKINQNQLNSTQPNPKQRNKQTKYPRPAASLKKDKPEPSK